MCQRAYFINLQVAISMVAHRCQSKKKSDEKIKNNKIKNENKKIEKKKKYYSEKNPTKISWPLSAKSDT